MLDLESIGLTKEELQERVIAKITAALLSGISVDDEGNGYERPTALHQKLNVEIAKTIDKSVETLAAKHILPNVTEYVEKLTLQTTNKWGEKKGEAVTFIEYLTQRAEFYLEEKVDYEGKSKPESGGYGWDGKQTRLTHLVHKHLHYSIASAMEAAIKNANAVLVGGIEATVKLKLKEIADALKVDVKTK